MNKSLSTLSFSPILLITLLLMAPITHASCNTSEKDCYGTAYFENHQKYEECLIVFYYETNGRRNICLEAGQRFRTSVGYGDRYCWIGKPEQPEPCVKQPINLPR